jgi:hypothetical protein
MIWRLRPRRFASAAELKDRRHEPVFRPGLNDPTADHCEAGCLRPADFPWLANGLAASFFPFGYALIYWRNADMDLMVIYNALVLNDGKPQLFFDHTAYLTILSLKLWFQLLHALGLLDTYSLSAIPPAHPMPQHSMPP